MKLRKQNIKSMKTRISLFIATLFMIGSLSSCYVDLEIDEPFVDVTHISEYETKDVIYQEFENGKLIYEEAVYKAWLEIDLWNSGGLRARNVEVEIVIFDQNHEHSSYIRTQDIRPGESITLDFDTGYDFSNDYIDYEVYVYWD